MSRLLAVSALILLLTSSAYAETRAADPNQNELPAATHIESVTQSKGMSRLPSIFHCRPEPLYCHPEPVCITKLCPPLPWYCYPEPVCKYPICRPEPWFCHPEPVCLDPEPRCCNQPHAFTGKALLKGW